MQHAECRAVMPGMISHRTFVGAAALVFATTASLTIVWCASMSSMGEMSMPGGWTMSMAWMRMPGQTWFGAAASFVAMWVLMMVAMMLPSLVPLLWRYREAVAATAKFPSAKAQPGNAPPDAFRLARLTALVGLSYYLVWTVLGIAVFPVGALLAAAEMQSPALARAVPLATGLVIMLVGALQLTAWKTRHLACCRAAPGHGSRLAPDRPGDAPDRPADVADRPADVADAPAGAPNAPRYRLAADGLTAWRYGLHLGRHCIYCCAGLTAILLVVGVMDLRAMAVVTAAITFERLAPAGERVARIIGVILVGVGLAMIAVRL